MAFVTTDEANRLLISKIVEEAARNNESLSAIDEHELRTPGCGHTADEDEAIDATLPVGYSHWALRVRAARYLRRAYHSEGIDDVTRSEFKAAYAALRDSPYILTNLSHADSPLLNAVEWLHLRAALEFATVGVAAARVGSLAPPQAAGRPTAIALISTAALCAAILVTAMVLRLR